MEKFECESIKCFIVRAIQNVNVKKGLRHDSFCSLSIIFYQGIDYFYLSEIWNRNMILLVFQGASINQWYSKYYVLDRILFFYYWFFITFDQVVKMSARNISTKFFLHPTWIFQLLFVNQNINSVTVLVGKINLSKLKLYHLK